MGNSAISPEVRVFFKTTGSPEEGLHCHGGGLLKAPDDQPWLQAAQGPRANGPLLLVAPVKLPVDPIDGQARHRPQTSQDKGGGPWGGVHGDPEITNGTSMELKW